MRSEVGRIDCTEIPIRLSCWEYTAENYSSIVYGRAAYFFNALAEALGTSRADELLRAYYEANRWGLATTESLRNVAESSCGCDLTNLFESWIYPN